MQTEPPDARVSILNIIPKYYPRIQLQPGRYHIEVSKRGHSTHKEWIEIAKEDRMVTITLENDKRPPDTFDTPMTVKPQQKKEWRDPVTGMEFVWVPKGCFDMGSNEFRSNETPVHEVCVDGFWMGKYEVTQGQWEQVMGNNPSRFKKGDNYLVEKVSLRNDIQDFVRELNAKSNAGDFRLPTEAEWEYACRSGGKQEKYCGGNDVNRVAWHSGNSGRTTHPVGKKAANGLGLYVMSGNVWEWVSDWYDEEYYNKRPRNNPQGPNTGSSRVLRGSSWYHDADRCRSAYRDYWNPGMRYASRGFRLARTNP